MEGRPKGDDPDEAQDTDSHLRAKLRSDIIQAVAEQHDMFQSWALQWKSDSMKQVDELHMTVNKLCQEVQLLTESRGESQSRSPSRNGPSSPRRDGVRRADSSVANDGKGVQPWGAPTDLAEGVEDQVDDTVHSANSEVSRTAMEKVQSISAHGVFAESVGQAAQMADAEPIAMYWEQAVEYAPWLKKSSVYEALMKCCIWLFTAEEPKRSGWLFDAKSHWAFEAVCMAVILANTVAIFISANQGMANLSDTDSATMLYVNAGFTVFYFFEMAVKLLVHRIYFFLNADKFWNSFDMMLVATGMLELIVNGMLGGDGMVLNAGFMRCMRLIKLAKILRVVRVMRFFKELRLMLKCVVGSFVSLFWAFVMLMCFNLLFAIFFVQQITNYIIDEGPDVTEDYKAEAILYYGSVQTAMLSLFKGISGGNDWDTYFPVVEVTGWFNAGVFIFYILVIWISLTNIITSIFVEKALDFAKPGLEEEMMSRHMDDRQCAQDLKELFMAHDIDGSNSISWAEFNACLHDKRLSEYLLYKGLDLKDAQAFFSLLAGCSANGEVDTKTIIGGCLKLRGAASNVDVWALSEKVDRLLIMQNTLKAETQAMRSDAIDQDHRVQQAAEKLEMLSPTAAVGNRAQL